MLPSPPMARTHPPTRTRCTHAGTNRRTLITFTVRNTVAGVAAATGIQGATSTTSSSSRSSRGRGRDTGTGLGARRPWAPWPKDTDRQTRRRARLGVGTNKQRAHFSKEICRDRPGPTWPAALTERHWHVARLTWHQHPHYKYVWHTCTAGTHTHLRRRPSITRMTVSGAWAQSAVAYAFHVARTPTRPPDPCHFMGCAVHVQVDVGTGGGGGGSACVYKGRFRLSAYRRDVVRICGRLTHWRESSPSPCGTSRWWRR
jgi:hypothetical protein